MSKRILATVSSFDVEQAGVSQLLEQNNLELVLNPHKRKLTAEELLELVKQYQPVALLAGTEPLGSSVLEKICGPVKIISRVGTGWDNVDLKRAETLGVQVYRTPDAVTEAVAELTLGLMLSLARHITIADRALRQGQWQRPMGVLLSGKTAGLIGFGRIGRKVAQKLKAIGLEVIAFDPNVGKAEMTALHVQAAQTLEELLVSSSVISLHCALTPDHKPIIDNGFLARARSDLLLINTARGELIDEQALLVALRQKRIAGAALDVFQKEPYVGPLTTLDNVLLTPHVGSYALEARLKMEKESLENVINAL